nr:3TM-type holin [uncultured Carboxylicivirga sp.]
MKVIDSISEAIEKTGEAFDKNFTSKEEILDKLKQVQEHLLNVRQSILLAEANGSKLQRNWRPILMLMFGVVIVYNVMFAPILFLLYNIPKPELTPDFWDVLKLSIGGYVIGRSGEKILPGVVDTAKKMVLTRKERREERKNGRQD